MKRLLTALLAAAAVVLSAGASALQAGPLTPDKVAWTYNFYPASPDVTGDGHAPGDLNHRITFSDQPKKDAAGSSDIVASNLKVFSLSSALTPDTLSGNGAYTMFLALTSTQDGKTFDHTFEFHGKLAGSFSEKNATVANVFDPATKKQTFTLGGFDFTVEMLYYTPPGPPEQGNVGSIGAHVTVANPGPSSLTPEPSSLLMAGLGLSFFGGAAWRKKRRQRAAAVAQV